MACRERSGGYARPRGPAGEQPRRGPRVDRIPDQTNRRHSPGLQESPKLISFSSVEPDWRGRKANSERGEASSAIARLEARHAFGIVVDDAAQTRIAGLRVQARFEWRNVLTFRIAPRHPLRLRVIKRPAPTPFLRGQQARAGVNP